MIFEFFTPPVGYSSDYYGEFVNASQVAYLYHWSLLASLFPRPLCVLFMFKGSLSQCLPFLKYFYCISWPSLVSSCSRFHQTNWYLASLCEDYIIAFSMVGHLASMPNHLFWEVDLEWQHPGPYFHHWQGTFCLTNDIHQWSSIKQFPLCSTTRNIFTQGIHVVPWVPFSLLVEFLSFVSGFHYWLLLK